MTQSPKINKRRFTDVDRPAKRLKIEAPKGSTSTTSFFVSVPHAPKEGTWKCTNCLTPNGAEVDKCLCYEHNRFNLEDNLCKENHEDFPDILREKRPIPTTGTKIEEPKDSTSKTSFFVSMMHAPKEGTWKCTKCLALNGAEVDKCLCCEHNRFNPEDSLCKEKHEEFPDIPRANRPVPVTGGFLKSFTKPIETTQEKYKAARRRKFRMKRSKQNIDKKRRKAYSKALSNM